MKTRVRLTIIAEYDIEPDGPGYVGLDSLDECIEADLDSLRNDVYAISDSLVAMPEEDIKVTLEPVPMMTIMIARRPRLKSCVEQWPDAETGKYNPDCCRFPKSCSADVYDDEFVSSDDLESVPSEDIIVTRIGCLDVSEYSNDMLPEARAKIDMLPGVEYVLHGTTTGSFGGPRPGSTDSIGDAGQEVKDMKDHHKED